MMQTLKKYAKKKTVIGLCSLVAVTGTVAVVEWGGNAEPIRYVMAATERGTLITSISGTGQVSGKDQIDVTSAVSGAVTNILVEPGEAVTAGTPLFEIDRRQAVKTVRDAAHAVEDARLAVQSSELSLKKQKQPADAVQLVQAQNAVNQARRALDELLAGADEADIREAEAEVEHQKEQAKLASDGVTPQVVRDAYDDAVPTIKSISQTLTQAVKEADAVLGIDDKSLNDAFENVLSVLDSRKLADATVAYQSASAAARDLKQEAEALTAFDEDAQAILDAIDQAEDAIYLVEPLMQKTEDVLAATIPSASFSQSSLDALRNSIRSEYNNISSKLASLTAILQSIEQAKTSYKNAQYNVAKAELALEKLMAGPDANEVASARERLAEAEAAYAKLKQGPDSIDLAISENSLARSRSSLVSAQNRLADAQEALNDYTVRAPFDGVVARILVRETDQASGGLATLLTDAKIAEISLNEVDVAKVKPGQKASLTFDAIPDLTIAGTVAEVDPIGDANQGVVSYAVKLAFATQDERVKSGMSVSASIVTDVRADVLMVPNSAVQSLGEVSTVQIIEGVDRDAALSAQGVTSEAPPTTKQIETGLSNEQMTEIKNGMNEGDLVVTRTIDPSQKNSTAATTNRGGAGTNARFQSFGGGGGPGGAVFISR